MRVYGICPKCGATNQFEAQYDNGWQVQCITCGKILTDRQFDFGDNDLRKRYDITGSCIQSPMSVNCLIHFSDSFESTLNNKLI